MTSEVCVRLCSSSVHCYRHCRDAVGAKFVSCILFFERVMHAFAFFGRGIKASRSRTKVGLHTRGFVNKEDCIPFEV